jgi:hypothetical protein
MERNEHIDNTDTLTVPGVKGKLEVSGTNGIFFRVVHNGEALKTVKGRWLLPTSGKNASGQNTTELRQRGFLPGFTRLYADGEQVYAFGAYVPTWLRVIMFVPLLLVLVNPLFGLGLGILMFFMNILIVKNRQMPIGLRAALPIVNTLAAGLILALLSAAASNAA